MGLRTVCTKSGQMVRRRSARRRSVRRIYGPPTRQPPLRPSAATDPLTMRTCAFSGQFCARRWAASVLRPGDRNRLDASTGLPTAVASDEGFLTSIFGMMGVDLSTIGDGLRARSRAGQQTESALACNILNRMTELGRPASYRIGR